MPLPGLGIGDGMVVNGVVGVGLEGMVMAGAVGVGINWEGGVCGGRLVVVGLASDPPVQAAKAEASAAANKIRRRFILYPGRPAAARWMKANGIAHQLKRFIVTSIFCSRRHSTASATLFNEWAIWDDSS